MVSILGDLRTFVISTPGEVGKHAFGSFLLILSLYSFAFLDRTFKQKETLILALKISGRRRNGESGDHSPGQSQCE